MYSFSSPLDLVSDEDMALSFEILLDEPGMTQRSLGELLVEMTDFVSNLVTLLKGYV